MNSKLDIGNLSESERTLILSWWHRTMAANLLTSALDDQDSGLNSPAHVSGTVAEFRDMGLRKDRQQPRPFLPDPHLLTGRGFAVAESIMRDRKKGDGA